MSEKPVVSVITITWNNLSGLKKTVESIAGQTAFDHVEYIIIDGASTDGSVEYITQNKSLFSYWQSEKDKGIYDAMNIGLSKATGDYVWFMNAGDYAFDSTTLEQLLIHLREYPDVVYGETMMVTDEGKHLGHRSMLTTRKLPAALDWKSFSRGMTVSHQSIIVKRSIAVPYDLQYRYVADMDWVINCLKLAKTVINARQTISCFTVDGFSAQNRNASNKQRYHMLKKHYGTINNLLNHAAIFFRKLWHTLKPDSSKY